MQNYPLTNADQFFATARERYLIKLARESGKPWPWTSDKVFQQWRFTNVHREDDKTTVWFRENVREPLSQRYRESPTAENFYKIVEATVIFRWFTRISTGERIKDLLLGTWDTAIAKERLQHVHPVVTGAYMIKTINDLNKLDGILISIEIAQSVLRKLVPLWTTGTKLEKAWSDLQAIPYLGGFMAYEVVTDLRWTPVLEGAPGIMTWGNLGPGAIRGMGWVVFNKEDGFTNSTKTQKLMLELMRELLALSKDPNYWPLDWKPWELHEVEMWLCEFSKYKKAEIGIPQKRKYTPEV